MPEGRQSPPPETQTGAQVAAPASGQGTDNAQNKEATNKAQLEVGHAHGSLVGSDRSC